MKVEQLYTSCLSQGSYYIRCGKEAAIIDPLREVSPYIEKAKQDGVSIKYIFETHFHADFVSGHLTLSEKTGAPIIYGPNANPKYKAHIANDGDFFQIGNAKIKVLHTPGHTLESTTYLLIDHEDKHHAIFTGDTLFLGDVGRPDLAQKAADITQEDLAGMLFDSLRTKIMPLADDLIVYPAHGAGSACGKSMMKETVDTLGNQKQMNYALRADMTKAEFIKEVTDGLLPPPAYFPLNVKLNKEGYDSIDAIIAKGAKALSPIRFAAIAKQTDVLILDVRKPQEFAKAHIPNSIFIGLDGSFAPWVGSLLADIKQPILLLVPEGRAEEAVTRLARVGFDNTFGYLEGGIEAWQSAHQPTASVASIPATNMATDYKNKQLNIIDVRKPAEFLANAIKDAQNLPLSDITQNLHKLPNKDSFYVHCAGGYRSMIAASIIKSKGIHNFIDIQGGFGAMKKTGLPIVCQSTCSASK